MNGPDIRLLDKNGYGSISALANPTNLLHQSRIRPHEIENDDVGIVLIERSLERARSVQARDDSAASSFEPRCEAIRFLGLRFQK